MELKKHLLAFQSFAFASGFVFWGLYESAKISYANYKAGSDQMYLSVGVFLLVAVMNIILAVVIRRKRNEILQVARVP